MTSAGELTVTINGRDLGLSQLLTRITTEGRATDLALTAAGQRIAAAMNGTVNPTLQEAQALARLAASGGQGAAGITILRNALSQQESVTARSIAATQQLVQMETRLAQQASGTTSTIQQLISAEQRLAAQGSATAAGQQGLRSSLEGLRSGIGTLQAGLGAVGIAFGAQAFIQGGIELAKDGAIAQQTSLSFNRLAQQAGTTGAAMTQALRAASGGEINDLNLQLAASRANMLGVATQTKDLASLMEIARNRAQYLGTSTEQAFNDLVVGLGRGSALILDNLAITVKVGEANESYAKSIGKTVDQLTAAEQKQALINTVLAQGRDTLAATGGALDSAAGKIQTLQSASDNARNAIGGIFAAVAQTSVFQQFAQSLNRDADAINLFANKAQTMQNAFSESKGFTDFSQKLAVINADIGRFGQSIQPLTASQYAYAQALTQGGVAVDVAVQKTQALNDVENARVLAIQNGANGNAALAQSLQDLGPAYLQAATGSEANQAGVLALLDDALAGKTGTDAFAASIRMLAGEHMQEAQAAANATALHAQRRGEIEASRTSTDALTVALGQEGAEAAVNAVNSQTLSITKQNLEAQARAAANALLASGAAGAATAARLAASSSQVDILTAAYYRLAAAQAAANASSGLGTNASKDRANIGRIPVEDQSRVFDQMKKAKQAQEDLTLATGTASQKQAVLNHNYEQARRYLGDYNATTIKAKQELIQFQQQQDKADAKGGRGGKGKGGAAGGAGKLSDQQKLNNQLAADETKYQNQQEDALEAHQKREADLAKAHAQKLLDIQNDYNTKVKAAENSLRLSSLQSRAGFYAQLAGIEDAGLRQSMSARYEQAAQEAQEIARTQGADAAKAYLDAAKQAIQNEASIQAEIDKATNGDADGEGKDAARAEYLQGVLAAQKAADEEELRQVREQGSAIANERDRQAQAENDAYSKATADEDEKYAEAQGKITESSNRSAEAKIANAQRSGKAVDAENVSLQKQAELLDQINTKAGGKATGTPTSTPSSREQAGGKAGVASEAPAPGATARNAAISDKAKGAALDGGGDVLGKLDEIKNQIAELRKAVTDAGRGVETSVGRLGGGMVR